MVNPHGWSMAVVMWCPEGMIRCSCPVQLVSIPKSIVLHDLKTLVLASTPIYIYTQINMYTAGISTGNKAMMLQMICWFNSAALYPVWSLMRTQQRVLASDRSWQANDGRQSHNFYLFLLLEGPTIGTPYFFVSLHFNWIISGLVYTVNWSKSTFQSLEAGATPDPSPGHVRGPTDRVSWGLCGFQLQLDGRGRISQWRPLEQRPGDWAQHWIGCMAAINQLSQQLRWFEDCVAIVVGPPPHILGLCRTSQELCGGVSRKRGWYFEHTEAICWVALEVPNSMFPSNGVRFFLILPKSDR